VVFLSANSENLLKNEKKSSNFPKHIIEGRRNLNINK
jgi:hypothetical protein